MIPKDLLYARTHEWVKVDGNEALMGITDFAQEQLGDLTFIELPQVGDTFAPGDEIGTVESVKAASEIYAPVAGEVIAVNEELESAPETVNQDPYEAGWMVRFKVSEKPEDLMTAAAYQDYIAEEG